MEASVCTSHFSCLLKSTTLRTRCYPAFLLPRSAIASIACKRSALRICRIGIRATGSDLSDPERFTGEDYYISASSPIYGSSGGFDAGDSPSSFTQSSISEKLEAASQLSESVPSNPVSQLEGGGGDGGDGGHSGGGRGGGGDGGDSGEEDKDKDKKKMLTSQKITLAYAALVGVGGAMGYAKSKSTKSLTAGLVSASVLLFVYTQLPSNPVFASSVGLGISALLLVLMGNRFKKSGKIFPAGVVSLVSLIMTGGYIHGIMRSSHA